jgi:hypothetical protein
METPVFITDILQWLNDTSVADSVRNSIWLFPAFETLHVAAIVLVIGSIARLDLRLAGLVERDRPVTDVANQLLPWTWISFAVATVFGLLLFISKPFIYLKIAFFDTKMILILLAGVNMLLFQAITSRNVATWDRSPLPPMAVRLAAGLSLAFWISVLLLGRFIGFV